MIIKTYEYYSFVKFRVNGRSKDHTRSVKYLKCTKNIKMLLTYSAKFYIV